MSASTRWLIGVGGAVLVVAVVSAVVALMASGPDEFEEGTPERVVQRYLAAVADRDATEALSFLSDELVDRCGTIPRESVTQRGDSRFRATLEETITRDGTAQVRVAITESFGDPPFDGGESTWSVTFELVQENGEWRFLEAPWPTYCPPKPLTEGTSVPATR
ncbi:MAG: hypothetical protein Q7K37_12355 [Dehalococcoidia bacterium]|nr:hypothetical protein [Dehalococcoidia bacterium]